MQDGQARVGPKSPIKNSSCRAADAVQSQTEARQDITLEEVALHFIPHNLPTETAFERRQTASQIVCAGELANKHNGTRLLQAANDNEKNPEGPSKRLAGCVALARPDPQKWLAPSESDFHLRRLDAGRL